MCKKTLSFVFSLILSYLLTFSLEILDDHSPIYEKTFKKCHEDISELNSLTYQLLINGCNVMFQIGLTVFLITLTVLIIILQSDQSK